MNITCTEKYVLIDRDFNFSMNVNYTEYQQLSQDEFETKVVNQDVIIISDLAINEKVLNNNPDLKLIALCSTGYDHVDLDLIKKHNVKVCNIRSHAGDAVAEHAFTFMINLIKNFDQQVSAVRQGQWSTGQSSFCLAAPLRELKDKTLVIVGKGGIGQSLAEKAKAFGMNVLFSERKNAQSCREGYVPFIEALSQADIVSLHCALNEETKELIDAYALQHMKKGSILINVGRGGLINNKDVIDALQTGQLAGFGADVLDQEPPAIDHELITLKHPNVLITGHIAWATDEAQQRLFNVLEDNINKNMQGVEQNLI